MGDPSLESPSTVVLLGECTDQGPIKLDELERDLENLHRVADALPVRFDKFVVRSKLARFTPEEIEVVRRLNEKTTGALSCSALASWSPV
jgi:hypothetical protein